MSGEKRTDPAGGLLLLGLMLGAAVGAAIGLLYAPRPGAESRREFADWAEGLRRQAQDDASGDAGVRDEAAPAMDGRP